MSNSSEIFPPSSPIDSGVMLSDRCSPKRGRVDSDSYLIATPATQGHKSIPLDPSHYGSSYIQRTSCSGSIQSSRKSISSETVLPPLDRRDGEPLDPMLLKGLGDWASAELSRHSYETTYTPKEHRLSFPGLADFDGSYFSQQEGANDDENCIKEDILSDIAIISLEDINIDTYHHHHHHQEHQLPMDRFLAETPRDAFWTAALVLENHHSAQNLPSHILDLRVTCSKRSDELNRATI